ncbi:MAG TPA: urease accessory protein UreF [Devosiaceae bacterium]|jgi:urease accessory protein
MTDARALQRLLTWMSPSFPVGAFAWSAGLESAIAEGAVRDSATTKNWLEGTLLHGGPRTDAILLAQAYRAAGDRAALAELADLCLALIPARERRDETLITGDAFIFACKAWPVASDAALPTPCPYPIAVGALAATHDIGVGDTVLAFLTATLQAQVSVAVRLIPLGQTAGLGIMAALEPQIATLSTACVEATLADLGSIAYAADIAQMRHETLPTRIFRS